MFSAETLPLVLPFYPEGEGEQKYIYDGKIRQTFSYDASDDQLVARYDAIADSGNKLTFLYIFTAEDKDRDFDDVLAEKATTAYSMFSFGGSNHVG